MEIPDESGAGMDFGGEETERDEDIDQDDTTMAVLDILNFKLVQRDPRESNYASNDNNLFEGEEEAEVSLVKYLEEQRLEAKLQLDEANDEIGQLKGQLVSQQSQFKADQLAMTEQAAAEREQLCATVAQLQAVNQDLANGHNRKEVSSEVNKLRESLKWSNKACVTWRKKVAAQNSEIDALKQKNRKLAGDLQGKIFYLGEVERVMESQKNILTNTKDRAKTESETLGKRVAELERQVEKEKNDAYSARIEWEKASKDLDTLREAVAECNSQMEKKLSQQVDEEDDTIRLKTNVEKILQILNDAQKSTKTGGGGGNQSVMSILKNFPIKAVSAAIGKSSGSLGKKNS